MKPTSRELLEKLNSHHYNQITLYRFNTTTLEVKKRSGVEYPLFKKGSGVEYPLFKMPAQVP